MWWDCLAALDYCAGKAIPVFTAVDSISLKLFLYLWERQFDSLRKGIVAKVIRWMLRADNSLARSTARWQIHKVRDRIDNGEPAVLALIRVKGISDPAKSHQVLAPGYDFDQSTEKMTISLYDPNYPGQTPGLTMNLAKPSEGIEVAQSSGEPVRGFFVIDYGRQTPP